MTLISATRHDARVATNASSRSCALPTLGRGQESLAPPAAAEAGFIRQYPAYATTTTIDAMRTSECGRLTAKGETYLDYTCASVHAVSQVNRHVHLLSGLVAGNPHSGNVPSRTTTALIGQAWKYESRQVCK
jgi:hypothetical protein